MYQIKRGDEVLMNGSYLPDTCLEAIMRLGLEPLDTAHFKLAYYALECEVMDGFGKSYDDEIFEKSIKPLFAKYGLTITKE